MRATAATAETAPDGDRTASARSPDPTGGSQTVKPARLLLALLLLLPSAALATTKYITDEFEVTMRSGTSTSNSIVKMLKSGAPVTVLDEDLASQYSLVEAEDGKQGYVLSRFLMERPAARQSLEVLEQKFAAQQARVDAQTDEIRGLEAELAQARADNEALKNTLRASEQELSSVRNAAAETLEILEQNKQLQSVVGQLQQEQSRLVEENSELRDTTRMDWFIRGGAVSLIAFVIGILVTRIRWRKQDSWGSY